MTPKNPEDLHPNGRQELPDYSDEAVQAPAGGWLKDPAKRRRLLRLVVILLIVPVLFPLYRGLKEWRASSLIGSSSKAFAIGDAQKGISLLKQALALAPGSPSIQHAVELYNARAGDPASFDNLVARMKAGAADEEELLGIAEIAAIKGRDRVAREALGLLSRMSGKRDFLRRSLLEASLSARKGDVHGAAEFCLRRAGEASSREDAGYLRIQAALNLLSVKNTPDVPRIRELLQGVIGDRSKASIAAWRIMAQLLLFPPEGIVIADPAREAAYLSGLFPSLSGGSSGDELMAADLAIKSAPDSKKEVVARLLNARRFSSKDAQLDLARWLNGKGCQKEVIAMASGRSTIDTDWLLVVMDARSVLGEWNEIPAMLASPAGSGIPDAVRHLYLARIAMMRGDNVTAEEEWRNVGASLRLEKPETLAYIAGYEERIGAYDRAIRSYREMADRDESKVNGLIGMIRCHPPDASAKKLIPLYEELVLALPENQDAACDLFYLRLLAKEDVAAAAASAERLFLGQPNALTRLSTAALGRLRTGNAKGAADLYRDKVIDWRGAAAPWRAVRCAVLRANHLLPEAKSLQDSIDQGQLRPEERGLIGVPPR